MDWLENLFFGAGIAHGIFAFALVITIGVLLGRVKVAGISLGVTWARQSCGNFARRDVDSLRGHNSKPFWS